MFGTALPDLFVMVGGGKQSSISFSVGLTVESTAVLSCNWSTCRLNGRPSFNVTIYYTGPRISLISPGSHIGLLPKFFTNTKSLTWKVWSLE